MIKIGLDLDNCIFDSEPIYSMYSLGGFPGLYENGNTSPMEEEKTKARQKTVVPLAFYSSFPMRRTGRKTLPSLLGEWLGVRLLYSP